MRSRTRDSGRYWSVRSPDDVAERHGLDQAEVEAVLAAPGDHAVVLVLVHALQRHRVDADGEAGRLGGEDAVQHLLQLAPAGHGGEGCRVQRVERDVDAADAGGVEVLRHLRELGAVGGERQLLQFAAPSAAAEGADQAQHVLPHQRLAAGQADALDAEADEGAAEAVQLLQAQDLGLGQEGHVLRHAVDAAEVAAIGDRDAEIGDPSAERIDHGSDSLKALGE